MVVCVINQVFEKFRSDSCRHRQILGDTSYFPEEAIERKIAEFLELYRAERRQTIENQNLQFASIMRKN